MNKVFLFLMLGMFMLSFAAAFEFDNVKEYDEVTRTATVKNCNVWVGVCLINGDTLATLQLTSPLNVMVAPGYQKVAEFTLENYRTDYGNAFQDMNFYDLNVGIDEEFERAFDYKYLTYENIQVPDYETVCTIKVNPLNNSEYQDCQREETGFHWEERESWIKFSDINELPPNTKVTIGIFTEVETNDKVEWVPTFMGVRISEWAGWESGWEVGLLKYYNFEEASETQTTDVHAGHLLDGTVSTVNVGFVGNAKTFAGGSTQSGYDNGTYSYSGTNWTWCVLFNTTQSTLGTLIVAEGGGYAQQMRLTGDKLEIRDATGIGSNVNVTNGSMIFGCATWVDGEDNMTLYINGALDNTQIIDFYGIYTPVGTPVLNIGAYKDAEGYFIGNIDEIGIWDRAITATEVSGLYAQYLTGSGYRESDATPNITLNSPLVDANYTTPQIITFNYTASDDINLTDVKFYVNSILNQTNASGINDSNYLFNLSISDGTYIVQAVATDDASKTDSSSNITITIDTIYPQINVEAPITTIYYKRLGDTETLNVTFTDTNLDTCWYNYNGTNTTITGCLTTVKNSTTFLIEVNNTNMTVYSNDTLGNENSTFINWSYTYFENNRTHNTTSMETAQESFAINVEGAAAVALLYNGTSYAMTKSGNDYTVSVTVPVKQLGNKTIIYRFDGVNNSDTTGQNITATNFTYCDATFTAKFWNFTFKDEGNLSILNGSIPTSNFTYYLGNGSVTKEYIYVNVTEATEFDFCSTTGDRTLNVDARIQYESTGYPQRVIDPAVITLSNASLKNTTLYLLATADGIYVTFQVINSAEQVIEGVFANASRTISSVSTQIGAGSTDAAGAITMWLNPNFIHSFVFSKTGYTTYSTSFAPTQTSYTVNLGTSSISTSDYSKGITYSTGPKNNTLINDTSYDFYFTLNSTIWTVTEYGYILKNGTGTVLGTESASTDGGTLTSSVDTVKNVSIKMEYYWVINGTYTNYTKFWIVLDSEGRGWSLDTFRSDLVSYVDSGMFGLDDFGLKIIIFLIILLMTGITSYIYGIVSTEGVIMILFFMVALINWGLGFTLLGLPGSMDFFPTIFLGAVAIALFIRMVITR